MLLTVFEFIIAYFIGSVCSAVIVSRLFGLPDPRSEGSKNPGATNVLRLAGKKYAAIVLVADMLKGLLPVLFAKLIGAGPTALGYICFAAVLGHMYPLFFGFKGGKGVATAIGALLGFQFYLGILVVATWLIVANVTRYSSLASIIAMTFSPLYSIAILQSMDAFIPLLVIAIFILYKHHENVTRLLAGEESKIHFKKAKKNP